VNSSEEATAGTSGEPTMEEMADEVVRALNEAEGNSEDKMKDLGGGWTHPSLVEEPKDGEMIPWKGPPSCMLPPPPPTPPAPPQPPHRRLLDGVHPTVKQLEPVLTDYLGCPAVILAIRYKALEVEPDLRLLSHSPVDVSPHDLAIGVIHYVKYPKRPPLWNVLFPSSPDDAPKWYQRLDHFVFGPQPEFGQLLFCPHQVSEALETVPLHVNVETLKLNSRVRVANVIKPNVCDLIRTQVNAGSELVTVAVGPTQLNTTVDSQDVGPCTVHHYPSGPTVNQNSRYTRPGSRHKWPAFLVRDPADKLEGRRRTASGLLRNARQLTIDAYRGAGSPGMDQLVKTGMTLMLSTVALLSVWTLLSHGLQPVSAAETGDVLESTECASRTLLEIICDEITNQWNHWGLRSGLPGLIIRSVARVIFVPAAIVIVPLAHLLTLLGECADFSN